MKILLFGKYGQLARELQRTLLSFGDLIIAGKNELDFGDLKSLSEFLHLIKPDVIVNAAAYTDVDGAENNIEMAYKINSEAVSIIAEYTRKYSFLLVHYSTSYVFDGNKSDAYVESDIPNPLNIYGKSKLAGEQFIVQNNSNAIILRTNWVYGHSGNNFIENIIEQAKGSEFMNAVTDQFGVPTSAELIADVTALTISGYKSNKLKDGIYHLTARGETTPYSLACYIVRRALENDMKLKIKSEKIQTISTNEYPSSAVRPKNSCLDTRELCAKLNIELPNWKIHVDRFIKQMTLRDSQA